MEDKADEFYQVLENVGSYGDIARCDRFCVLDRISNRFDQLALFFVPVAFDA